MIPEPNFPVKPREFVGRRLQLEAFRDALRQALRPAEPLRSPCWANGA